MDQISSARRLVSVAALIATLATVAAAQAAVTDPDRMEHFAGRDIAIWLPPDSAGPHPLVLFSHALGGCSTQSAFLMRALAEDGMLVAAPDHEDADGGCPAELPDPKDLPLGFLMNPDNWKPTFYDHRRDDLRGLWAALQTDPAYATLIDPDRVALVGHSLGGYTVLGLTGAWPSWKADGIAAVVALAPFAHPFVLGAMPLGIDVPVLFQAGSKDDLTQAPIVQAAFSATAAPACMVVYQGADHFAWTDLEADYRDATVAATIAFLDEVFAGRPLAATMLASPQTDGEPVCKTS